MRVCDNSRAFSANCRGELNDCSKYSTSQIIFKTRVCYLSFFLDCIMIEKNNGSLGRKTVKRSLLKSIGLLVAGCVFVAMGVQLVQGYAVGTRGEFTIYLGWVGLLFFGPASILIFWSILFGARIPVEFSQTGFTDRRSCSKEIPWKSIAKMVVDSHHRLIRLQLTSNEFYDHQLTRRARAVRWIHKPFGKDGIFVSSSDLDISFANLLKLMRQYLSQYSPSALEGD